jgi:hypothetical protein
VKAKLLKGDRIGYVDDAMATANDTPGPYNVSLDYARPRSLRFRFNPLGKAITDKKKDGSVSPDTYNPLDAYKKT